MGEKLDGPSDRFQGCYRKYRVQRLGDRKGKHRNCQYFVLDLDHDKFAVPALEAYARACLAEFPALAADLQEWAKLRGFQWANAAEKPAEKKEAGNGKQV
jgi:hypothetical protein